MSAFRFEIDKKNAIRIWDDSNPNENDAPFFLQPTWPNGTEWASKGEAEEWALTFLESLENPESEFLAGDSPEEPKKVRPIIEDSAAETPVE
jgi:hypothetical protein